jgi:hypothetical protein
MKGLQETIANIATDIRHDQIWCEFAYGNKSWTRREGHIVIMTNGEYHMW